MNHFMKLSELFGYAEKCNECKNTKDCDFVKQVVSMVKEIVSPTVEHNLIGNINK